MGRKTKGSTIFRSAHNQLVTRKALHAHHVGQEQQQQEYLEMKIRNRRKPIMVGIQIQSGRLINIDVSPDDTLDHIKEKICMREGISPDQQVLFWNGKKLLDGTVDELGILASATVFLTLRNWGG